jgi:hypothetical protein
VSELLGCPWDGEKPTLEVRKVGHRDEPSTYVYYECPKCGATRGTCVDYEGEELAHAFMYGYGFAKPPGWPSLDWWHAAMLAMESTVRGKWNRRAS